MTTSSASRRIRLGVLVFFLAHGIGQAAAQDYWTLEQIEAQMAAEARSGQATDELLEPRGPVYAFTPHLPVVQMLEEAAFIVDLQVIHGSASLGGMREGEKLLDVIQTDNTTESIWVWSRYKELTGDLSFDLNIRLAWLYLMNHPAYQEEGGGGELGYYRVYNCGWAMIAEPVYRALTGDESFLEYARTCAQYVIDNALTFTSITPTVMRFTQAWGAGALYRFAVEQDEPAWRAAAVAYGEAVRAEVVADPGLLSREAWALSGGTMMWGILESTFAENPGGKSFAATFGPLLDVEDTTGQWRIAHTAWYALARQAVWKHTAEAAFLSTHHLLYDRLLSFDGDDDGGIPTTSWAVFDEDESWVSNYLAFMALDPMRAPFDAAIASDVVTLAPGGVWDLALAVGNQNALFDLRYVMVAEISGPAGYLQPLFPPRELALPPRAAAGIPSCPFDLALDLVPGVYTATLSALDTEGLVVGEDRVELTVD